MWETILAGAAGQALPFLGQREANQSNENIANNTNAMSAAEAQRNREFQQTSADRSMAFQHNEAQDQMKFQEQMSSTAIRRAAHDMKEAGINPILAVPNAASSPSGASGNGAQASGSQASFQAATMKNALEGFSTAARDTLAIQRQETELGKMKADTARANMETRVMSKSIPEAEAKNSLWEKFKQMMNSRKDSSALDAVRERDEARRHDMREAEKAKAQADRAARIDNAYSQKMKELQRLKFKVPKKP